MPLYELTHQSILPVEVVRFYAAGMKELPDLQRLLLEEIGIISQSKGPCLLTLFLQKAEVWQQGTRGFFTQRFETSPMPSNPRGDQGFGA